MRSVEVFLLDKRLDVQYGLNWGRRDDRNPSEAYLQLPSEVYKSAFFPVKGKYFVVETDDGCTLILNRAQKTPEGTALQSPENNALLGGYIRKRLGVEADAEIRKEDVRRYGRLSISFSKVDDMHFAMDFSKDWVSEDILAVYRSFLVCCSDCTKEQVAEAVEVAGGYPAVAFNAATGEASVEEQPNDERWRDFLASGFRKAHLRTPASVAHSLRQCSRLRLLLPSLRTKPFALLAGISGTGKSRIVRKLAQATTTPGLEGCADGDFPRRRWTIHNPANFCLVQVKPNWHNSMDVVGYLSNIPSPRYVLTPFVEFVVRAWTHTEVPFFLCLDEMNLAPVEEYFAEFLSAIESRSKTSGGYETDPIIGPFRSFGKTVCAEMVDALFPTYRASDTNGELGSLVSRLECHGLTLPPNLIVVGTVNMDDTTFAFSRKVLDRAMSLEMNEVDFDSFLRGTTDDDLEALTSMFPLPKLNQLLVDRHVEASEFVAELGDDAQIVVDYLKDVNKVLERTPFKLGYRVANEALIFVRATMEMAMGNAYDALDRFTLMKILSRVEGDETKLQMTADDGHESGLQESLTVLAALRGVLERSLGTGAQSGLLSVKKIEEMEAALRRDHFVSYWS